MVILVHDVTQIVILALHRTLVITIAQAAVVVKTIMPPADKAIVPGHGNHGKVTMLVPTRATCDTEQPQ